MDTSHKPVLAAPVGHLYQRGASVYHTEPPTAESGGHRGNLGHSYKNESPCQLSAYRNLEIQVSVSPEVAE